MGSLFDNKYSQCGSRLLFITEANLEPSQKLMMDFFMKIVNS